MLEERKEVSVQLRNVVLCTNYKGQGACNGGHRELHTQYTFPATIAQDLTSKVIVQYMQYSVYTVIPTPFCLQNKESSSQTNTCPSSLHPSFRSPAALFLQ